jgi:hypothetical protein
MEAQEPGQSTRVGAEVARERRLEDAARQSSSEWFLPNVPLPRAETRNKLLHRVFSRYGDEEERRSTQEERFACTFLLRELPGIRIPSKGLQEMKKLLLIILIAACGDNIKPGGGGKPSIDYGDPPTDVDTDTDPGSDAIPPDEPTVDAGVGSGSGSGSGSDCDDDRDCDTDEHTDEGHEHHHGCD